MFLIIGSSTSVLLLTFAGSGVVTRLIEKISVVAPHDVKCGALMRESYLKNCKVKNVVSSPLQTVEYLW